MKKWFFGKRVFPRWKLILLGREDVALEANKIKDYLTADPVGR